MNSSMSRLDWNSTHNNSLSAELVVNDQGQIVKRIAHFNFFNVSTRIGGAENQLNAGRDTGYTYGLDGLSLVPLNY